MREYKIKIFWSDETADYIQEIRAAGELTPKQMRDMFDLLPRRNKEKGHEKFDGYELAPDLHVLENDK